jgi:DNA-binding IclR family transcriptional regulator
MNTRTDSLSIVKETAETRRQQILDALFLKPPMTRAELARATGMRLSSVCGRVNELIAEGKVRVDGTAYDAETQRHVEAVTIT